jgi:membrane fusion protein, copper/silver efflux system
MRKFAAAVGILALVLVAFVAGAWWNHRPAASLSAARQAVYYTCPMHPQYKVDHPGDCPSCGMRLEPVQSDGTSPGHGDGGPLPAGAVRVSPERQQTIGVRLGTVERVSGTRSLRTTGRVAPNENDVYPLVAGSEGWVRDVRGATTGSLVRKNETLLTLYSPEFINAQQSYYSGLDTLERVTTEQIRTNTPNRAAESAERNANTLRNLGVSEEQLAEMRANRSLQQHIRVVAPVDGFVLERKAAPGLRFDRGFEFFRIADLRKVWILADLYANQQPFVRRGSKARVSSRDQDRTFEAAVSQTEPVFDEATRTLKVRLETDNRDFALKPGMFVDVELPADLPESLAVPADAIVDSGLRKTVFVDRGNGYFEPRDVETGWRIGGQVEILKGLMAEEKIVISGTFLVDSESRMKVASAGVVNAVTDPVCGMDVDAKKAAASGKTATHAGQPYYFCSDECKKKFEAEPGKYIAGGHSHAPAPPASAPGVSKAAGTMPAPSRAATTSPVKDVVCGMDIDPNDAAGTVEYGGKTFYFCSLECKQKFEKDPKQYVK